MARIEIPLFHCTALAVKDGVRFDREGIVILDSNGQVLNFILVETTDDIVFFEKTYKGVRSLLNGPTISVTDEQFDLWMSKQRNLSFGKQ